MDNSNSVTQSLLSITVTCKHFWAHCSLHFLTIGIRANGLFIQEIGTDRNLQSYKSQVKSPFKLGDSENR